MTDRPEAGSEGQSFKANRVSPTVTLDRPLDPSVAAPAIKRIEQKPEEQVKTPEEIAQVIAEAQAEVDGYKPLFTTIARDVSLRYKVSYGTGFYIDLEAGQINTDAKWYTDRGYTQAQRFWAHCHELGHFVDLTEDPEGVMASFDHTYDQAKKTGAGIMRKWEETVGSSDPEFLEKIKKQRPMDEADPNSKTLNGAESAAYEIHGRFRNIVDDIVDNNWVGRKVPRFEPDTQGAEEIKSLYSEKLFPNGKAIIPSGFSSLPRHLQFMDKLIREEMVPDEIMSVSDDVREALGRKIMFQGREYTPREIIDTFLKPRAGRNTRATDRNFVIQVTLEPIFDELLVKDLAEWKPQKPDQQENNGEGEGDSSGEANPFEENYDDIEQNSPDQLKPEDIKEWTKKFKEEKDEEKRREAESLKEDEKSPEQKAKEAQERMDRQWCQENNIEYETLKKYKKREEEIMPYLDNLSAFWRNIAFGSSRVTERRMEGYYNQGPELDIQQTIEEWPKIQTGDLHEVRNMKKQVIKEKLYRKPELIRARLLGDASGSMDEAKRKILEQCFVLLTSSLREFNTYLNYDRARTKSKLEVDTEAWIYGTEEKKVKRLRKDMEGEDELVETLKAFESLGESLGGTRDELPMGKIFESITPDEQAKISNGEIMEFLIELTDGGSNNADATKTALDDLIDVGVIARAFQIGKASDEEAAIFEKVWNENREEKLGAIVGNDLENVIPALTQLFKGYLKNVRL